MANGRIQLEFLSGEAVTETMSFDQDRIEIGKLASAHVHLDDENISRKHALIQLGSDGKVLLTDLGSTNGTRLNGMRVNKAHLSDGDLVELGLTRVRVRLAPELQSKAEAGARSARTEINREGFYRTVDGHSTKGRLALEGALLWEDSAIQVETFLRTWMPTFLSGLSLLFFALVPFLAWLAAIVLWALSWPVTWSIGFSAAGLGLALYFVMDMDGWRFMMTRGLWLIRHGESIHIGETDACRFFMPQEFVGKRTYALVVPHGRGWALNLQRTEVRGDVLHKGQIMTMDEARQTDMAVRNLLPIEPGTKCRLRFGQFTLLLSHVVIPRRPPVGIVVAGTLAALLAYMASLLIHFLVMFLFVYLQPADDIQIRRSDNDMMSRFFHISSVLLQEKEEEVEEEEDITRPEDDESKFNEEELDFDVDSSQDVDLDAEEEPEEIVVSRRPKSPSDDKSMDMTERKERAKKTSDRLIPTQQLARLEGLMGRNSGPSIKIIQIGGSGGPASDLADGSSGPLMADSGGGFPMNMDEMGGTLPSGTAGKGGKGSLITGLDKSSLGGGKKGKRFGNVKFKDTAQRAVVTTGRVSVTGGELDRAIIKKFINRQKGSIIYCYKKAVQSKPDLAGKVIVKFTISPTGKVMRPGIKKSTLGSASVESCIVSRLGMWRFPAPRNGGAVGVAYPFLFKTR